MINVNEMKKVRVLVQCTATYESDIDVPAELETEEEIMAYVDERLHELVVDELLYQETGDEEVINVLSIEE